MAFKRLDLSLDIASLVSYVNEVIAISGSIHAVEQNVKRYDNIASGSTTLGGYFQTVFDTSPTSSLSTPLFDTSFGYATGSAFNVNLTTLSSQNEKVKMYRTFAGALLGNKDSLFTIGGTTKSECFFLSFKRNIHKDELKKGTVAFTINTDLTQTGRSQFTASDDSAVSAFKQGIGGDYAPLYLSGTGGTAIGQVWYNAGIVVLPAEAIWGSSTTQDGVAAWTGSTSLRSSIYSSSIDSLVDGLRGHIERIDVHNQTNIHSTIYFCRATNKEFNYSSNPTFIDDDQRIRVTSGSNILQTRTYITTVGLYDPNDNLLAVAKVSKPITKSPSSEAILRVRLDY